MSGKPLFILIPLFYCRINLICITGQTLRARQETNSRQILGMKSADCDGHLHALDRFTALVSQT